MSALICSNRTVLSPGHPVRCWATAVSAVVLAVSLGACSRVRPHTQPDASSHLETISFGSCWHDDTGTTGPTISRLASQDPDLFLWLGDNVYADTTDMAEMRDTYDAKKNGATYRPFLQARIPVMATWDDHDFGENNAGDNYSSRAESQLEFLRHFDVPTDDVRYGVQDGVYNATLFGSAAQSQPGERDHAGRPLPSLPDLPRIRRLPGGRLHHAGERSVVVARATDECDLGDHSDRLRHASACRRSTGTEP